MNLLSFEFIAISSVAIVLLPLLKGAVRYGLLLVISLGFAASYLPPAGMVSTAAFLLAGYALARWVDRGTRGSVVASVALLTAAFVYLRGYSFLRLALPDEWMFHVLETAGLSFLFFKMLHVILDAAAGTLGELRLSTYLLYCLNFTTFLMGPIQRYQDFRDQWGGLKPSISKGFEAHLDAMLRILRGLVKKFVFAELIAAYTIHSGLDLDALPRSELLWRTYAFYIYLYLDFSGYCDTVIGIGMLMGVRPPENFNLPFLSRNVSEYWLRVHRSLTTWLTDYVFNPTFLSAMRSKTLSRVPYASLGLAVLITMAIAGLWHGTTLNFLFFGVLHGIYLIVWRFYDRAMSRRMGRKRFQDFSRRPVVRAVAWFITYNATSLAYLLFVFDLSTTVTFVRRFL